jgi:hypothetical protein
MPDLPNDQIRKTVALPRSLWDDVAEVRFAQRIGTESEAVRRIMAAGVEALKSAPKDRMREDRDERRALAREYPDD